MQPYSLNELNLVIPELWDKPWDEYIENSEGIEREFIVVQSTYARALRQIADKPVTPEKLAWLSLWSRMFGALTGARGATMWKSRFAVSVMERVAVEAFLHLEAVMLPAMENAESLDEHAWASVRARLRGYLAWCIYGDEVLYKQLLDDRILEAAFDPKPERALIEELGSSANAWESLTGTAFEVLSDQEAFHDRENAKKQLTSDMTRATKWLSDPRLRPWIDKLRLLKRESEGRGAVPLFSHFDLPASVSGFLRKRGSSIKYITYLKGSGFIHGSSLEASMLVGDSMIAPDFANLGRGFETATNTTLSECRLAILLLQVLSTHIASGDSAH